MTWMKSKQPTVVSGLLALIGADVTESTFCGRGNRGTPFSRDSSRASIGRSLSGHRYCFCRNRTRAGSTGCGERRIYFQENPKLRVGRQVNGCKAICLGVGTSYIAGYGTYFVSDQTRFGDRVRRVQRWSSGSVRFIDWKDNDAA